MKELNKKKLLAMNITAIIVMLVLMVCGNTLKAEGLQDNSDIIVIGGTHEDIVIDDCEKESNPVSDTEEAYGAANPKTDLSFIAGQSLARGMVYTFKFTNYRNGADSYYFNMVIYNSNNAAVMYLYDENFYVDANKSAGVRGGMTIDLERYNLPKGEYTLKAIAFNGTTIDSSIRHYDYAVFYIDDLEESSFPSTDLSFIKGKTLAKGNKYSFAFENKQNESRAYYFNLCICDINNNVIYRQYNPNYYINTLKIHGVSGNIEIDLGPSGLDLPDGTYRLRAVYMHDEAVDSDIYHSDNAIFYVRTFSGKVITGVDFPKDTEWHSDYNVSASYIEEDYEEGMDIVSGLTLSQSNCDRPYENKEVSIEEGRIHELISQSRSSAGTLLTAKVKYVSGKVVTIKRRYYIDSTPPVSILKINETSSELVKGKTLKGDPVVRYYLDDNLQIKKYNIKVTGPDGKVYDDKVKYIYKSGKAVTSKSGKISLSELIGKYPSDGKYSIELTASDNIYTISQKTTFKVDGVVEMHRLYNPNSGEHFYTASTAEKDNLVSVGWNYEGLGWRAPSHSNTPVYRLYNANAGDHHYTMSASERDTLIAAGWKYEGIGWYSDDNKTVPLYRQYNPNAVSGSHNYTMSLEENNYLVSVGWKGEGIGWYGVK